jgi:hypothetical protein
MHDLIDLLFLLFRGILYLLPLSPLLREVMVSLCDGCKVST